MNKNFIKTRKIISENTNNNWIIIMLDNLRVILDYSYKIMIYHTNMIK